MFLSFSKLLLKRSRVTIDDLLDRAFILKDFDGNFGYWTYHIRELSSTSKCVRLDNNSWEEVKVVLKHFVDFVDFVDP